jgi:hypothetical protein
MISFYGTEKKTGVALVQLSSSFWLSHVFMFASYNNRFISAYKMFRVQQSIPSIPSTHVFRIIEKCTLYCTVIFNSLCLPTSYWPFLLTEHDVTPRRSRCVVSPPLGQGGSTWRKHFLQLKLETSHVTGPFVGQDYIGLLSTRMLLEEWRMWCTFSLEMANISRGQCFTSPSFRRVTQVHLHIKYFLTMCPCIPITDIMATIYKSAGFRWFLRPETCMLIELLYKLNVCYKLRFFKLADLDISENSET